MPNGLAATAPRRNVVLRRTLNFGAGASPSVRVSKKTDPVYRGRTGQCASQPAREPYASRFICVPLVNADEFLLAREGTSPRSAIALHRTTRCRKED